MASAVEGWIGAYQVDAFSVYLAQDFKVITEAGFVHIETYFRCAIRFHQ